MPPELIRVFDSQGEDYKQAFQVFLNHTDQKRNAKRVLQKLVDGLPVRRASSTPVPAVAKSLALSPRPSTAPSRSNRTPTC
jgi:hypothetical protein